MIRLGQHTACPQHHRPPRSPSPGWSPVLRVARGGGGTARVTGVGSTAPASPRPGATARSSSSTQAPRRGAPG